MCYHKALTADASQLEARYNAEFPDKSNFKPVYHANAFLFPHWPIITHQQPQEIQFLQWGLIPRWVRSREQADELRARTLNAKAETMTEKPSFRGAVASGNRCLIPVTGFYEWHTEGRKKFPFFIEPADQNVLSIAGIWDEWTDRETGEVLRTYSLLTTDANPLLARIHNTKQRMPVMLTPELEHAWLHNDLNENEVLSLATQQYPDQKLHSFSIGKRITSQSEPTDVPEVQEAVAYPELQKNESLFA